MDIVCSASVDKLKADFEVKQ